MVTGRVRGGRPYTKGCIYKILSNRIYLGEAMHKGIAHPGEHQAIIDQRAWDLAHAGHGRTRPDARR